MANEVGNIGAISPVSNFQYNPYAFDDLDMNFGIYPMMGMDGSIFGNGYFGPGMGMGIGMNNGNYFNNMKDYQKFYIDYNVDQQKMQRNADLRINASVEAVKGAATILKDKVVNNEQDQIIRAFEDYVKTVKAAYGPGSEDEIKSRALSLYAQMNGGTTLYQDLRNYAHGSMTQGFIHALSFGTYNRKSAEDNISEISGAPVGTGEKASHNFGRLAGAATAGIGAGTLTHLISKGTKDAANIATKGIKLPKLKGKAAIVGLIVGGVAATLSFLTGKVTT